MVWVYSIRSGWCLYRVLILSVEAFQIFCQPFSTPPIANRYWTAVCFCISWSSPTLSSHSKCVCASNKNVSILNCNLRCSYKKRKLPSKQLFFSIGSILFFSWFLMAKLKNPVFEMLASIRFLIRSLAKLINFDIKSFETRRFILGVSCLFCDQNINLLINITIQSWQVRK